MEPLAPRMPGGIAVEGLSRSFGSTAVLGGLSFRVEPGEVVGIVGGNGSGKTTLLRILAGSLTQDGGTVRVAGRAPGRGASSYVPAGDRGLHWRLSGRRNLAFHARLAGARGAAVSDRCQAAAERVGALSFIDLPAGSCSTGQRRRLMVAQALVGRPAVLLLDEPLEDLDSDGAELVEDLCRAWADADGTVIVAAPDGARLPATNRRVSIG